MRSLLTILALFVCADSAFPQSHIDGFIVLNSGDTLEGHIRKPAAAYLLHHHLMFRPKNEKDVYRFGPDELKGFKIGDEYFVSHYVWRGSELVKKFLRSVVSGSSTLYEYIYTQQNQRGMVSAPIHAYYLARGNDPLHLLNFKDLKRGEDLFFADNVALTTDIQNGVYDRNDLPEIVERYNRERFDAQHK